MNHVKAGGVNGEAREREGWEVLEVGGEGGRGIKWRLLSVMKLGVRCSLDLADAVIIALSFLTPSFSSPSQPPSLLTPSHAHTHTH